MRHVGIAVLAAAAVLLAGCGGGSDGSAGDLRDGVYRFELSEQYLRENGISAQQARDESGVHEVTLDDGSFVDRWRAGDGRHGACFGTYAADGNNRVKFYWSGGCTGDWAMSYSIDGDVVTWSDFEPLDANAGPEEQKVTEVFNGVPWMRTGDVPEAGEQ